MKECVQPLPEVEYLYGILPQPVCRFGVSLTDGNNRVKVDAMQTDPGFLEGIQPAVSWQDMVLAKRIVREVAKAVVVCASVARKLFGTYGCGGAAIVVEPRTGACR